MTTLSQDLIKLEAKKKAATAANKKAKEITRDHDDWERHCFARMDAEETDSQRARGTLFSPVAKRYATVQDRSEFIRWAEENEPDLVKTVEQKADVDALVRRCLDDGEPLPPGLGFYVKEYISQRKAAS